MEGNGMTVDEIIHKAAREISHIPEDSEQTRAHKTAALHLLKEATGLINKIHIQSQNVRSPFDLAGLLAQVKD
jgi:hypothetical protein